MGRYHGGSLSDEEKAEWQKQAKKEGFDNIWNYIKWLIRSRIQEQSEKSK